MDKLPLGVRDAVARQQGKNIDGSTRRETVPVERTGSLPSEAAARKALPLVTGVIDYFPDAIAEVARVSRVGNDQHNPGQPLHWAKGKSTDHADSLLRHLVDRGKLDSDGVRHSGKVAWRALALLQTEIEAERARERAGSEEPAPFSHRGESTVPAVLASVGGSPPQGQPFVGEADEVNF